MAPVPDSLILRTSSRAGLVPFQASFRQSARLLATDLPSPPPPCYFHSIPARYRPVGMTPRACLLLVARDDIMPNIFTVGVWGWEYSDSPSIYPFLAATLDKLLARRIGGNNRTILRGLSAERHSGSTNSGNRGIWQLPYDEHTDSRE